MRLQSSLILIALGSGCAFQDGDPWATAEFDLTASLNTDGREVDGKLKNVRGDLFELESFEIDLDAVSIAFSGGDAQAFDPANPPEGFSLCHNGHCHAEDGSLVDYADVVAQSSDGVEVVFPVAKTEDISSSELSFETGAVSVDRGFGQVVSVRINSMAISGTATTSDGDDESQFSVTQALTEPLVVTLERNFGDEKDDAYAGELNVSITASVLDGLTVTPAGVTVDNKKLEENFYEFTNVDL